MDAIVYILTPYFGGILLYIMIGKVLPYKKAPWTVFVYPLILLICGVVKWFWGSQSLVSQTVSLLSSISANIICPMLIFGGSRWKRIWVTVFFFAIQLCTDVICYVFFRTRYGDVIELYPLEQRLLYTVICLSLFAMVSSLCVLLLRTISIRKFQPFYLLFLIFPLSLTALASCYLFPDYMTPLWLLGVLLGLGAEIGLLEYTINQEQKTTLEQELQAARHAMALEHQHYQEVESRREELARIRHDFNNQLAAIEQMIRTGADDDAQRMIARLAQDIRQTRENPYCAIPVVNAVLMEKQRACAGASAALEVELQMPPSSHIESLHLCSIFSNLLDNAIAGVKTVPENERLIRLTTKTEGDYLFIKTTNPSAPPQKTPSGRGLGQKILKDLAARYNGEFLNTYKDGTYTVMVTLQQE